MQFLATTRDSYVQFCSMHLSLSETWSTCKHSLCLQHILLSPINTTPPCSATITTATTTHLSSLLSQVFLPLVSPAVLRPLPSEALPLVALPSEATLPSCRRRPRYHQQAASSPAPITILFLSEMVGMAAATTIRL